MRASVAPTDRVAVVAPVEPDFVHELSAFLKTRKGFSAVRVGRSQRLFYATALVAIDALLGMPADAPDAAKKRDLLQTLMLSGILLFIAASMAASGI